ncbi:flagellar protein FlaG [Bacillota bacterium LX-D]|nr:flagellar protein FlaG [Bacillota bacterium LX-D]
MLTKIPGIDPVILNNIKERTQREKVQDTKNLKIAERDSQGKGRQWKKEGSQKELEEYLEEVNEELAKVNQPIRLEVIIEDGRHWIAIKEAETNKVLQRLSPRSASSILGRALTRTGYLLDNKV